MNDVEQSFIAIINQVFDVRKKIEEHNLEKRLIRNLNRIDLELEKQGCFVHNPIGEKYDPSRLDCEAMVSGGSDKDEMVIVEVIKPIVYQKINNKSIILQKAVIIVE